MSSQPSLHGSADLKALLLDPTPRRRVAAGAALAASGDGLRAALAVADAVQLMSIGLLSRHAFPAVAAALGTRHGLVMTLIVAALAVAIRRALRPASAARWRLPPPAAAVRATIAIWAALAALAVVITLAVPAASVPDGFAEWLLLWAVLAGAASALLRLGIGGLAARLDGAVPRMAIVGAPEEAAGVTRAIEDPACGDWRHVGCFDDRRTEDMLSLMALVQGGGVEAVTLAIPGQETGRIAALRQRLQDQPVLVSLAFDAGALGWQASKGGLRLVDLFNPPQSGWAGLAKRAIDLGLGTAALLLLAPALLAAALAVKLESPGPVLFRQWRFGAGSRPFEVLKFRTMRDDAGDATGEQRTTARDPRVTRVGRFLRRSSIDELPQLLNVLRGEMSLVGPRPHPLPMRVAGLYYFEAVEDYRGRHLVRPGITGWAQINGSRGEVDTLAKARRRVELDRWYIDNWSLRLDLWILLRTALGGFLSRHAD